MDLLKYLLPLFFVIFSFAEIAKMRFGVVSVGLIDLILLGIIIIWLLFVKKSRNYKLLKPILIFSVLAAFSLLINLTTYTESQLFSSALYLLRFILYAGIYFVIVDLGKKYNLYFTRLMSLTAVLVLGLGFLQIIFYPSLKNLYYLGYDEHMYRMFGTFLDPNFIGIFLVLFFILIFVFRNQLLPKKWNLIVKVFLILDFVALILTFSRGALIMFIVSIIIYSVLMKSWKIPALVFGSLIFIFILLSPLFYLENINPFRMASSNSRLESSKKALEIFAQKPMGVGFNAYRFAREDFGDKDASNYGPSHAGAGVDNSYVFAIVTAGFMGLTAYLYLLFSIFKLGLIDARKNNYAMVLILSLGGLMVNALFINSLFYGFVMLWIWILVALTENSLRE